MEKVLCNDNDATALTESSAESWGASGTRGMQGVTSEESAGFLFKIGI